MSQDEAPNRDVTFFTTWTVAETIMEQCMQCFGRAIREGPLELRCRHLEALSDLLRLPVCSHFWQRCLFLGQLLQAAEQDTELLALTEEWYHLVIPGKTAEELFGLFKQPIPQMHCVAGANFKTIAPQLWGLKIIRQLPG